MQGAWSPGVSATESNKVDFRWTNGPFSKTRAANDQVLLVIYSQKFESFVLFTDAGTRESGFAQLKTAEEFRGDTVHCYLSFYSTELEFASTTEYLGEVTIL